MRSEETRKILKKQNYLYSLYECSEKEINVHILNPFKKLLFGQKDKKEIYNLPLRLELAKKLIATIMCAEVTV